MIDREAPREVAAGRGGGGRELCLRSRFFADEAAGWVPPEGETTGDDLDLGLELEKAAAAAAAAAGAGAASSDEGAFESGATLRLILDTLGGSTLLQTPPANFIVAAATDCWAGVLPWIFMWENA